MRKATCQKGAGMITESPRREKAVPCDQVAGTRQGSKTVAGGRGRRATPPVGDQNSRTPAGVPEREQAATGGAKWVLLASTGGVGLRRNRRRLHPSFMAGLHHRRHALSHFVGGDVFDVGRDRPSDAERVFERAGAVAVELVLQRAQLFAAGGEPLSGIARPRSRRRSSG